MTKDWKPPEEFEEYRILRPVGAGAMGQVFLAHDTTLDRAVAVKFIGALDPDSAARDRFLVEARALARLQHPNVVTVYRVGELGRRPYLVSEFIRGQSLDKLDKPVAWRRVLELAVGISRGLAAAHRRGVLHRDIKPANTIVAEDGEVKLLDFGLAKLLDAAGTGDGSSQPDGARSSRPSPLRPPTPPPLVVRDRNADPFGQTQDPDRAAAAAPAPVGAEETRKLEPPAEVALATGSPENGVATPTPHPSLTRAGAVMGTPYYMAPEVWRAEPASARSDVYSVGAMLYELLTGKAPNRDVPVNELMRVSGERDAPPVASIVADLDPRFGAIVDRCVLRKPDDRFATADELRDALEQVVLAARGAGPIPAGNPYRGLQAFEAEHRALFFGRGPDVRAALELLRSQPFLLCAGDSGVGKSSLCRAGVVPAVADGALGDGRTWSVHTLVPGKHPLAALAAVLARHLSLDEVELEKQLGSADEAVYARLRRALTRHHGKIGGLLLFVDQLEELVTLADRAEAAAVGEALARLLVGTTAFRLLATVRGDFLTRVASVPGLGNDVTRALFLLRPLSAEATREAIIGPARAKNVTFESEALVTTLVEATAKAEGGLPLLQFALAELWDARDQARATITAAALEQIGGVAGALARHADEVLARLLPAQRTVARRILLRLVTAEGTRARRPEAELIDWAPRSRASPPRPAEPSGAPPSASPIGDDPIARGALDGLLRGRLLVAREADDATAYEVAHEALIQGWETLRGWLDENAEQRVVRQRLEIAAAEWQRLGRVREALMGARQLAETTGVDLAELTDRERDFLARSRSAVRRRRLGGRALLVGIPLLLLASWGGLRLREDAATRKRAVESRRMLDARIDEHVVKAEAIHDQARVKNLDVETLRGKAFQLFDARDKEAAERVWAEALALAIEVDRTYALSGQALETALMLDPMRHDVRVRLGGVLFERALLADRDRQLDRRDELFRRVTLYDETGEHVRRWNAPALLAIATAPAGAEVTIERIVGEGGLRKPTGARRLGVAPLAAVSLEHGAYVLSFAAPGRAPVRLPIVLARDERLELVIDLPLAAAVPEGYVYVPPGRFLVGSAAEDLRREFLGTVPLHEARTGGYLIAQRETTYAEYIAFLATLPPEERVRRSPHNLSIGFHGGIELSQSGGTWELRLQPTTTEYRARAGQKIVYRDRSSLAEQDWLQFPVSAVSREDAERYAAWLDATGKLYGARLCSEHEWERAARGADDREWPHGDRLIGDEANFDETYGRKPLAFGPDQVGSHPASRSPFGVYDMAGNVHEWTVSSLANDGYAMRGGAYYYGHLTARSTNRWAPEPTTRDLTLGFRVCATPR